MDTRSFLTYQRMPIERGVSYLFRRALDKSSQISVKVHDVTRPESVIASGWRKTGYRTFNLSKLFGIDPDKAGELLQRTIGSRIYKGDVIASSKEWFGMKEKVFRSPLNGILLDYNSSSSRLTIQYLPTEIKTVAGVPGKVMQILPGEQVVIGTRVNLIHGLVGFGVDREGSVVEIGYPDIPIQTDQILPKHKGKVIFGGTSISIDALYKALSMGVQLVITGGINFEDYVRLRGTKGRYEDVGISVLATEGFAATPIYPPLYDLLKHTENRHVFFQSERKAIVIPLSQDEFKPDELPTTIDELEDAEAHLSEFGLLHEGAKVRVISSLNYGAYGIVNTIDHDSWLIEVTLERKSVKLHPTELELIIDEND